HRIFGDRQHTGYGAERFGLGGRQLGAEAVERIAVVVHLAPTDTGDDVAVTRIEETDVTRDVRIIGLDLVAALRLGRRVPGNIAFVRDHRIFRETHDVVVIRKCLYHRACLRHV